MFKVLLLTKGVHPLFKMTTRETPINIWMRTEQNRKGRANLMEAQRPQHTLKGPKIIGKSELRIHEWRNRVTEEEFLKQQNMSTLKLGQQLKFFCKHTYRDTKRRKCHFCLALCSVFIVVLFSLVINTIVARGPIIFLKMAEATEGEIDGIITPS